MDIYICIKTPDVDKQKPVIKQLSFVFNGTDKNMKLLVPLEAASNLNYWQELYEVERRQIMAVSFKQETFEQDCWRIAKALSKSQVWSLVFFGEETEEEAALLDKAFNKP